MEDYEEDEDTYNIYKSIFVSTHNKCPVCGTTGYLNGNCLLCDSTEYEETAELE